MIKRLNKKKESSQGTMKDKERIKETKKQMKNRQTNEKQTNQ